MRSQHTPAQATEGSHERHTQDGWVAFPEYGAFFRIAEDGSLLECVMMNDGSMGTCDGEINSGEVTAPESQEFLDGINAYFGTSYHYDRFAGR